jgi:plasmid maintenance system antidote protein VapI
LESLVATEKITFRILKERLLVLLRSRIANGEYTERGFARLLGISQSQAHNVLKGARTLNAELADQIMAKLGLTAQQLLDTSELELGLKLQRDGQSWRGAEQEAVTQDMTERDRLHSLRKQPAATKSSRAVRRMG